jgi:hypothetical protein
MVLLMSCMDCCTPRQLLLLLLRFLLPPLLPPLLLPPPLLLLSLSVLLVLLLLLLLHQQLLLAQCLNNPPVSTIDSLRHCRNCSTHLNLSKPLQMHIARPPESRAGHRLLLLRSLLLVTGTLSAVATAPLCNRWRMPPAACKLRASSTIHPAATNRTSGGNSLPDSFLNNPTALYLPNSNRPAVRYVCH